MALKTKVSASPIRKSSVRPWEHLVLFPAFLEIMTDQSNNRQTNIHIGATRSIYIFIKIALLYVLYTRELIQL